MIVSNARGLQFSFSDQGLLQSIEVDPIRITMTTRSVANLYLRKRGGGHTALLGAGLVSSVGQFSIRGVWEGLSYQCSLRLSASQLSWQWSVRVENTLDREVELDLIYVQDVGLKAKSSGLVNEYYVSQYLERRVLEHAEHGSVVCCRQNMKEAGGHPWLMVASTHRAASASTDGLQFFGRTFRATGEPEALRADRLGGELSGEASIVALQQQPFMLAPGQSHTSGFVATYLADHPDATSERDLQRVVSDFPADVIGGEPIPVRTDRVRLLPAEDLTQAELTELFGRDWRHREEEGGQLLSFFTEGPRHVVLRAKETRVDRPHGHIMQANVGLVPDEKVMSTTAFACGVFHSHLTQGNTNFSTLLSVCTNPSAPNLEGQRIFVQREQGRYLLGVPSAFEMGLNACRWIYKHGDTLLQVNSWTSPGEPLVHLTFEVLRGAPVALSVTHQFDELNGWSVDDALVARPRADSMLAGKFPCAQFRLLADGPVRTVREDQTLILEVPATASFSMRIVGECGGTIDVARVEPAELKRQRDAALAAAAWRELSRGLQLRGPRAIEAIDEVLPWFGLNALIHFLTPYGLEQFSGAAWGTRDVSQGPVDFLLCQDKLDEAKQTLRVLFSHQDADGGWPQWWMFDSFASVRADGAHGDVTYWCILALCSYVRASGDFAFLQESLPYFAAGDRGTVSEHVDRILALVTASFVPGTALVQFGGGDWNDSLQPVSEDLARRLISSWTVEMCYQAFSEYRELCERAGDAEKARGLQETCTRIHADFHRHLVKDGVVAGYGLVEDQRIDVLLHPTDGRTGVRYSLLPMNRGVISGMFSPEQAAQHRALIEQHLKGPDGARLMDRPLRYHGGLQTIFQRAESSTYFGREIGLMYTHEHLRYAESLARTGHAEAFLRALRQAIPVDYRAIVPQGDLRQTNCYYSSSDVSFRSRYEADERYDEVIAGHHALKGGWRVYSSGPGIYIALVVTRLLGLRVAFGELILDPVLAPSLHGLQASLLLRGRAVTFHYRVEGPGFGPRTVKVNGKDVSFGREANPYREGGATLALDAFLARLDSADNTVEIVI